MYTQVPVGRYLFATHSKLERRHGARSTIRGFTPEGSSGSFVPLSMTMCGGGLLLHPIPGFWALWLWIHVGMLIIGPFTTLPGRTQMNMTVPTTAVGQPQGGSIERHDRRSRAAAAATSCRFSRPSCFLPSLRLPAAGSGTATGAPAFRSRKWRRHCQIMLPTSRAFPNAASSPESSSLMQGAFPSCSNADAAGSRADLLAVSRDLRACPVPTLAEFAFGLSSRGCCATPGSFGRG
mmetsp:Transcript_88485/g.228151  ORF Transcript_88485/g.228151 Transcript_88485/m.228151 type:complete len:236 (+) Transcript_88485:695-1402(+)